MKNVDIVNNDEVVKEQHNGDSKLTGPSNDRNSIISYENETENFNEDSKLSGIFERMANHRLKSQDCSPLKFSDIKLHKKRKFGSSGLSKKLKSIFKPFREHN
ncbi:MAG: hypothetical protein MHPSP_003311 [Paramarteilia canceri]